MKPDRDIGTAEEEVTFFFEIGRALSQWAHVENHLRKLAGVCVSRADAITVQTGFLSIENFRSKLQFTDALMRRKLSATSHIDRWAQLHNRCQSASKTRNKIAHSKPVLFLDGDATRRWSLVDWDRPKTTKGSINAPPGSICIVNVVQARLDFLALTNALANFRCALEDKPEPYAKYLEQATDPPTIRPTRNQIRAALGLQLLPSLKTPRKDKE